MDVMLRKEFRKIVVQDKQDPQDASVHITRKLGRDDRLNQLAYIFEQGLHRLNV